MPQPTTKHFHNTVQLEEKQLDLFCVKAKNQEDQVIEVFNKYKCPMAWFQVFAYLPFMNEISLKRAMSNLTKPVINKAGEVTRKAMLVKIEDKSKMVLNGSTPCHLYKLIN